MGHVSCGAQDGNLALHCGGVVSCISSPIPHADCLVWIRREGFGRVASSYLDVYKDIQLQTCSEGDIIYQPRPNPPSRPEMDIAKKEATRVESYENQHSDESCVSTVSVGQRRVPGAKEVFVHAQQGCHRLTCTLSSFDRFHVQPRGVALLLCASRLIVTKKLSDLRRGLLLGKMHSPPAPAPVKVRARNTDRAHQTTPSESPTSD